jgi:hypothetical protein
VVVFGAPLFMAEGVPKYMVREAGAEDSGDMSTGKRIGLAVVIMYWIMSIFAIYLCRSDSKSIASIITDNMIVVLTVWGAKMGANVTDLFTKKYNGTPPATPKVTP